MKIEEGCDTGRALSDERGRFPKRRAKVPHFRGGLPARRPVRRFHPPKLCNLQSALTLAGGSPATYLTSTSLKRTNRISNPLSSRTSMSVRSRASRGRGPALRRASVVWVTGIRRGWASPPRLGPSGQRSVNRNRLSHFRLSVSHKHLAGQRT